MGALGFTPGPFDSKSSALCVIGLPPLCAPEAGGQRLGAHSWLGKAWLASAGFKELVPTEPCVGSSPCHPYGDGAETVAFLWGLWAWAYLHGAINSRHTLLFCRFCTLWPSHRCSDPLRRRWVTGATVKGILGVQGPKTSLRVTR